MDHQNPTAQTEHADTSLPQTNQQPTKQSIPLPIRRRTTVKQQKDGTPVMVSKKLMDLFLEEYLANNGNGTEAMLKVSKVKNRANAAAMAHGYLVRAQHMGKIVLEKKGYGYGKLIDVAIQKMAGSRTPEWWDRLMKIGGYEDFMTKQGVTKATVSVMSVQKELLDEYVDGEIIPDAEDD